MRTRPSMPLVAWWARLFATLSRQRATVRNAAIGIEIVPLRSVSAVYPWSVLAIGAVPEELWD